ncbi:MAG: hypothetical protein AAF251_00340 [Pseudomonadota bacterium]
MTRKKDNRTTRLPVPASALPDFTPVPSQRNRHDGWTPERQRDFIEALADTGSVEAACRHVNMSTAGAYRIRRLPQAESFREAWVAALDLGVQRLEDVAMERALHGVEEPYCVRGEEVFTRTRYNDRLLMFLLRNRAPERFGQPATRGGGSLKGLNAIGKMEKQRLKRKWRKQWEAEQRNVSPQEIRASIDRKLEAVRQQVHHERTQEWARLSDETKVAWARFEALRDRDLDAMEADGAFRRRHQEAPRADGRRIGPPESPEGTQIPHE